MLGKSAVTCGQVSKSGDSLVRDRGLDSYLICPLPKEQFHIGRRNDVSEGITRFLKRDSTAIGRRATPGFLSPFLPGS
jgi:hypothetical protein